MKYFVVISTCLIHNSGFRIFSVVFDTSFTYVVIVTPGVCYTTHSRPRRLGMSCFERNRTHSDKLDIIIVPSVIILGTVWAKNTTALRTDMRVQTSASSRTISETPW